MHLHLSGFGPWNRLVLMTRKLLMPRLWPWCPFALRQVRPTLLLPFRVFLFPCFSSILHMVSKYISLWVILVYKARGGIYTPILLPLTFFEIYAPYMMLIHSHPPHQWGGRRTIRGLPIGGGKNITHHMLYRNSTTYHTSMSCMSLCLLSLSWPLHIHVPTTIYSYVLY